MGEFADMAIDAAIDGHWFDDEAPLARRRRAPIRVTCKHCGQTDLRWGNVKGGHWRVKNRDGSLHFCSKIEKVRRRIA